jgi:hypothetical protein
VHAEIVVWTDDVAVHDLEHARTCQARLAEPLVVARELGQSARSQAARRDQQQPDRGAMVLDGGGVAVLSGLEGDADVTAFRAVADQCALDDLVQPEDGGDGQRHGEASVAQGIAKRYERRAPPRGRVQIDDHERPTLGALDVAQRLGELELLLVFVAELSLGQLAKPLQLLLAPASVQITPHEALAGGQRQAIASEEHHSPAQLRPQALERSRGALRGHCARGLIAVDTADKYDARAASGAAHVCEDAG